MPEEARDISEYRGMWLFTMFDLPVTTKKARKRYAAFRKELAREGFMMLQYSVYARYFGSIERSEPCRRRVSGMIPPGGHVRLMMVTDHQFGKMEVYHGEKEGEPEKPPQQIALF